MSKTVLFEKKADCCGCGACQNICPKGAIEMKYDAFGIAYPVIDPALCVECGLCKKVCSYQNQRQRCDAPQLAYAAAAADGVMAKHSASGGVFAALARHILKAGGVVYGCAFSDDDGILIPKHIRVDNESDLHRLQGSKYVQSITGMVYRQVKQDLKEGKNVLFSGTPCQVDALNGFLSPTKSENLLTVDIICHGTPGTRFFVDYIKEMEKQNKGKVLDFRFRDKTGDGGTKQLSSSRRQIAVCRKSCFRFSCRRIISCFLTQKHTVGIAIPVRMQINTESAISHWVIFGGLKRNILIS